MCCVYEWRFIYYCTFSLLFLCNILKDTPLFEAVKSGRTDIVKLLIKNGADINIKGVR